MSKYQPLYHHLCQLTAKGANEWNATFAEIENILGFELPNSAYAHPAWWANENNIRTHVQKHMWKDAGWRTDNLNLTGKKIAFLKDTV